MDKKDYGEGVMVRYLLGELSEEEKQELEERFFSDDAYFEQLQVVEDDLIDAYVRGELSKDQQGQFEKHFLATEKRRQRVRFARDLMESAMLWERSPDRDAWWPSVLGWLKDQPLATKLSLAATPLALLAGLWLAVETVRLGSHVRQLQAEGQAIRQEAQALQRHVANEAARGSQLAAELKRAQEDRERLQQELARRRPLLSPVLSFLLSPINTRDLDEPKRLHIPSGNYAVQLQLELDEERSYKSYRVELRTVKGDAIWSQDGLRARRTDSGKAVRLQIPSSLLTAGDYILTLKGVTPEGEIQDVEDYAFRVQRG